MKIYHLEANGRTNTGEYVQRITKALSTLLKKEVKVFTSRNSVHSDALDVFKGYAQSNKYKKLYYYYQGWRRLANILKRENEECIFHIHWLRFSPIDYFFLKKLNNQKNIRLVFTVHNILPHETMPFDSLFYRKIYVLFDNLVFHSKQNINDFNGIFPNCNVKTNIIPHYSYKVNAQIPTDNELIKLLFFGAIRPYKGLELLIDALKNLRHSLNWKLTIAGKPEYDISHVKEEVLADETLKRRVKWKTGWIEDEEIPNLFQQSHIVVLPYLKIDNSGLVHLAMSYGKTVIVPRIGVFNDLIEDGINGYNYELNNPLSLTETIARVINENKFKEIGINAIKKMDTHSIENIGESLYDLYKNLKKQ